MLYATALRLDRRAIKKLKVKDIYSLHRVVYSLFTDVRSEEDKKHSIISGIQWVDKGGDHEYRQILILSDRAPLEPEIGIIETKIIPESFLSFESYNFTTTLSPTRRSAESKKLIPIKTDSEIKFWFKDRSLNWGFSINEDSLDISKIKANAFTGKNNEIITLHQATITGSLTVVDPDKFQKSFRSGIGRARSFGCGLLQITPIVTPSFFLNKW